MNTDRMLVFGIRDYRYLQEALCQAGGWEPGQIECRRFPDNERYQRILTGVEDRDVVLVGGTHGDEATLELYDLACAMVKYGARSLSLVVPYYGYSTMERATQSGEVVTAKTRARLLSVIPAAGTGNRLLLLDLHSAGIPHYFEGSIRPVHVYAKPIIMEAARRIGGSDFVLAGTDAGRAKWVESLADDLEVQAAFAYKRRFPDGTTRLTAVNAQVEGKVVILYDDMIRTGGSLLNAAKAYRDAGARSLAAIATHGLFPGDSLRRLQDSGLFTEIVCTDSHPRVQELKNGFLKVESTANLLVTALRGALCS